MCVRCLIRFVVDVRRVCDLSDKTLNVNSQKTNGKKLKMISSSTSLNRSLKCALNCCGCIQNYSHEPNTVQEITEKNSCLKSQQNISFEIFLKTNLELPFATSFSSEKKIFSYAVYRFFHLTTEIISLRWEMAGKIVYALSIHINDGI